MFIDDFTLRILICLTLILLGLQITVDLLFYSWEHPSEKPDEERERYLDKDGNHSYYERSIIEKNLFTEKHPEVPYSSIRSPHRFFHLLKAKSKKLKIRWVKMKI